MCLFAMETKTAMHHTKETKQLCVFVFLFGDKKNVIFCFKVKYKGSMDFDWANLVTSCCGKG
jgi:hypothetical protein